MRMKPQLPVPPALLMFVGVVAISFSSIIIKWSSAPASVLGMYRLLFTVLLMLPFLGRYRQAFAAISRRDWILLFAAGVFLGLHFLFWIGSLKYTTVASSMILTALQPVFVMWGAFIVFGERASKTMFVSMGVALLGTIIVSGGDFGSSRLHLWGDLLSVLGTIAISIQLLFGQHLNTRIPPFLYSFLVFLVASFELAVYNLWMGVPFVRYPIREWEIFILLALVPTVFGHALFNWLLKYVRATVISMVVLGEPIGATVLAAVLLGESVNRFQVIGGIITLTGVLLFLRNLGASHREPVTDSRQDLIDC